MQVESDVNLPTESSFVRTELPLQKTDQEAPSTRDGSIRTSTTCKTARLWLAVRQVGR